MGCSPSKQVAPQPQVPHVLGSPTAAAVLAAESAAAKNTESAKATEAAQNAGAAKTIEATRAKTAAAAQDQLPTLELQPDKAGRPLELSARQKRLIQLQHPDAARVVVKELHSGASAATKLKGTSSVKPAAGASPPPATPPPP